MSESSDKVTETDVNMLTYFWQEKGCLTRWASWEERKEVIRKQYPEVVKAWEDYVEARRRLTIVINAVPLPDAEENL